MNMNIEKELKILVNQDQFNQLLAYYPTLIFKPQLNVYYDTNKNHIRNKKGAMRIRSIENKNIFTLKLMSEDGLQEYECEVENNTIEIFSKEPIRSFLASQNIHGPFREIGKLETQRAMFINKYAELCFDINTYNGIVDYEIEYEYKLDHDGITQLNTILRNVNLSYTKNCASKISRALCSNK